MSSTTPPYSRRSSQPLYLPPLSYSDQARFTINDRSVLNSGRMGTCHHSVNRQVPIQVWKQLQRTRCVPPVPHQITDDAEQRDELHACLLHAQVGSVTNECRGGARGLDVGKNRVTFSAEREREEGRADVCDNTGNDDLGLVRCFDGGAEFGIVPSTVIMSVCDFLKLRGSSR